MPSIHHVAIRTADYGRFASFYRDVFDAVCPAECSNPSVVRIDAATLHVFEVERLEPDAGAGHFAHYAIEVESIARFAAIRERLLARSSTDGVGLDFVEHVSLIFQDPDGFMAEVLVANTEPSDQSIPTDRAEQ